MGIWRPPNQVPEREYGSMRRIRLLPRFSFATSAGLRSKPVAENQALLNSIDRWRPTHPGSVVPTAVALCLVFSSVVTLAFGGYSGTKKCIDGANA